MMIKIGNIVSDTNLVNHIQVEYINYYDQPISFAELNTDLPTLYVGWKNLKQSNIANSLIQQQSILEKKIITNLLYWEYSFEENKSQHVGGIDMFTKDVPFYYFSSRYKYINYDPIFFGIQSIEDLFSLLPIKHGIDGVYNFKNEMLYILKDDIICGIDLKMYGFFEFDINKIISTFSENTSKYILDEDGSVHQKYYKILPFFDQLKRYIVVLLTKV